MKVGDLRKAIEGVDDDMVVLLRVEAGDLGQMMCSPSSAIPDAGCGEVEAFMIDGHDGDTQGEDLSSEREEVDH